MLVTERLDILKKERPIVASVFEKNWQRSLKDFSQSLFDWRPTKVEGALKNAFRFEFREMGVSESEIGGFLSQIEELPVLQTSHHVTPTNGPTFLAYDLISLSGLPEGKIYPVAANSGVPYSNAAWSGSISYGDLPLESLLKPGSELYKRTIKSTRNRQEDGDSDLRISLIPSRSRDQLLFGSGITADQVQYFNTFSDAFKERIVSPEPFDVYSHWACSTCSSLQQRLFSGRKIFYFDINRVIAKYLAEILLSGKAHPIRDLFYDPSISDAVNESFDEPTLFLGSYKGKKSFKIESLKWDSQGTLGIKSGVISYRPEELAKALSEKRLCPGIFLQFLVLRFINGIHCLGSFNQLDYLESYRLGWEKLKTGWNLDLAADYETTLTTGRIVLEEGALWPLDLAMKDETLKISEYLNKPMSAFWFPILDQLTG